MRSVFLTLLLALGFAPGLAGHATAETVLTITGRIAETNRAPYIAFEDAFFKHHERPFEKAYAFSYEMLKRLPQKSITAAFDAWPKAVSASGPALADVLKAAKAPAGAKLTVVALDGYAAEFMAQDIAAHDWIVAIDADGKPLGVGGRGPGWMMYDTDGKTLKAEEEGLWVWSVFMISVE
jgi:hypothetical protein